MSCVKHRASSARRCALQLWVLSVAAIVACSDGSGGPANTAEPRLIELEAAAIVEGFAAGRLRRSSGVAELRITEHPISRSQYQACVAAGACGEAAEPDCDVERDLRGFKSDADASPATCVGVKNAHKYCKFIGGRLPRLAEWFYAARGIAPTLYAWGAAAPSCATHPRAIGLVPTGDGGDDLVSAAPCAVIHNDGVLEIGKHKDGASPTGIKDVLLTPYELLETEETPLLSACGKSFAGCAVGGRTPGAIESLVAIEGGQDEESAPNASAYSFRCVLEGH
jgi:hypothetical protein